MQLMFSSFNIDDEDYQGYEFGLFGQLSEVRFVYLNRFIQEVSNSSDNGTLIYCKASISCSLTKKLNLK